MCKNRNKKFREKNNINIKYKMSKKGELLRLVAYGLPSTQIFEADVTIKRANEYDAAILTLDRLRGEVEALLLNPASKEFVTKEYQGIDVAGLRIALATGYKEVLRVETRDDVLPVFDILGVKEENGKVNIAVKAIGESANILQKKVLRKAKMEISLAKPIEFFTALADLPRFRSWSWSSEEIEAFYDSKKKTLNFMDQPWTVFLYSAEAMMWMPLELRFFASGEGEVIKVVAKVKWMKADGKGKELKVKLSNKGLNGVGMTAKNATKALDVLKSRNYSVRVGGRLADAFDIEGGGFGAQFWSSIGLDVEDGALLKKTKKVGLFELEFKTKDSDRILYKDGDTVRSKSVKSYLERVAGKYDEPPPSPYVTWWERERQGIILAMKTESGESVLGMLTDLRWDVKKELWQGTASLRFAEAERLQKKSTLIYEIWMGWQ